MKLRGSYLSSHRSWIIRQCLWQTVLDPSGVVSPWAPATAGASKCYLFSTRKPHRSTSRPPSRPPEEGPANRTTLLHYLHVPRPRKNYHLLAVRVCEAKKKTQQQSQSNHFHSLHFLPLECPFFIGLKFGSDVNAIYTAIRLL